jgi:NADPH:quinone reductase
MQAIRVHSYGAPDVLSYEELPTPEPGPGEVLIKVEAAAVNYADLMRRSNTPYPFPTPLPFTPGSEVAGRVVALGTGVAGPAVGSQVFALVGQDGSSGYAQYALANAAQVIPIPASLSADKACALIVAGTTALLALSEVARVQPGERVLVQAAGGGMGGYAVQIAKLLGAQLVIGAASSAAKREAARASGADEVVDYTQAGWPERVHELSGGEGVDVLIEVSGGQSFAESLRCLAPFGRVVVCGMASREPLQLDEAAILRFFYNPALNQSLHVFNLGLWFGLRPAVAGGALERVIGLAASGQLKIPVSQVLPLSQAAKAHRLIESRQSTGKIVLRPWEDG